MQRFDNGPIGILTKADARFYEGLAALLGSLRYWHPQIPVLIVDCGMEDDQIARLQKAGYDAIVTPDLSSYTLDDNQRIPYSEAIYAFFSCSENLFDTTVHLDADIVVTAPLDALIERSHDGKRGLIGVPDYPPLRIDQQIGSKPGILSDVFSLIPDLCPESTSFSGGVFSVTRDYYQYRLVPKIEQLMHLHSRLWGNDMAILNLAACWAAPVMPFVPLDGTYNTRPFYRRAPELSPNGIHAVAGTDAPALRGPFGTARVLHYVGPTKPWMPGVAEDASLQVWRFYREFAKIALGL